MSFLRDPSTFGKGRFVEEDDAGFDLDQVRGIEPAAFAMPLVQNPTTFCEDIKKTGAAPGLMDFKHGTTTLGFVFQHGIIIAVDSRASMGSYIGSQTVKKVIEINDFLLG